MGKAARKGPKYVQLFRYLIRSAAWRDLDGNARSIYVEMSDRYAGPSSNNGRIPYSLREAVASLKIGKATASRAIQSLIEHGFVEPMKKGSFSQKVRHATEWRLTEFTCDVTGQIATKDFMRWEPKIQNTVPPQNPSGASDETVTSRNRPDGFPDETVEPDFEPSRFHHRYTSSLPGGVADDSAEPAGAHPERRRAQRAASTDRIKSLPAGFPVAGGEGSPG